MNGIGYGITPFMGSHGILARSSGGGGGAFVNEYSMSFDGVDEYFKGSSTFSELDGGNKFTLSMWVKPTSFATYRMLFHIPRNTTASNSQVLLRFGTTGKPEFSIDTTSYYVRTSSPLTLDVWNHILVCVDLTNPTTSQMGRIYINSVDATSSVNISSRTAFSTSTGAVWLGEEANGYQNPFLNNMDEVAMWVGSDERANVADIYNGGVPFDLSTLASAPSHWWRMGDGDSWDGSKWTLNDNIGSYNLDSVNMEEGDRLPISPSSFSLYSFSFDGVDEYFTIADNDNLSFGNGTTDSPFSISAWVKMTDATRFRILFKADNTTGNNEYGFFCDASDRINFILYDSTLSVTIGRYYNVGLTSYQGTWIHLSATYDGSGSSTGLKIYLNGSRVDNTDSNSGSYTAMHNGNAPLEIGKFLTNISNGLMDEVSIFNTELSASDVTTIFNNGIPNDISSLSPISWWRMGEEASWSGSAWTLTDQGSGGNNATSVNMEEGDRTGDQPYVI